MLVCWVGWLVECEGEEVKRRRFVCTSWGWLGIKQTRLWSVCK